MKFLTIDGLAKTITSITRCGLYISTEVPASNTQLTQTTSNHLSNYRALLTKQLDAKVREARDAGYKVWFRLSRNDEAFLAHADFVQVYEAWFKEYNHGAPGQLEVTAVIEGPEDKNYTDDQW